VLADFVLVAHFALAAFVVTYPGLILTPMARRWPRFIGWGMRAVHGGIVVFVIAQAFLGQVCPLTTLEAWLRIQASESAYEGSFIEYWLRRLLYYEAPGWVFTAAYTVFGVLVAVIWWRSPPRQKGKSTGQTQR
jgi:hypothetical protein